METDKDTKQRTSSVGDKRPADVSVTVLHERTATDALLVFDGADSRSLVATTRGTDAHGRPLTQVIAEGFVTRADASDAIAELSKGGFTAADLRFTSDNVTLSDRLHVTWAALSARYEPIDHFILGPSASRSRPTGSPFASSMEANEKEGATVQGGGRTANASIQSSPPASGDVPLNSTIAPTTATPPPPAPSPAAGADAAVPTASSAAAASPPPPTVRVAVWNLLASEFTAYSTPTKTKETETDKQRRWTQTKTILERTRPDILLAQEVTREAAAFLDTTGLLQTTVSWAGAGVAGCSIFLRPGRFTVLDHAALTFRTQASATGTYGAAALALSLDENSRTLVVAGFHLEGKPDQMVIRQAQFKETRELATSLLARLPPPPPPPVAPTAAGASTSSETGTATGRSSPPLVIVGGDCNDKAAVDRPFTDILKEIGLSRVKSNRLTSVYGLIDNLFVSDLTRCTGPLRITPALEDRVAREGGVGYKAPPYEDPSFPSDHFLLVQDLLV